MTPNLIKIYLLTRKVDQADLCKRIEANQKITCKRDQLARTISGERRNQHIRDAMAAELNIPVDELFGDDFEAVTRQRGAA